MVRESENRQGYLTDQFKLLTKSNNLNVYYSSKRLLDVVLSIVALLALFPLMLVITLLIRLDSPGPVVFKQKRIGSKLEMINGQVTWKRNEFTFYKFRTMINNADESIHKAFIKALINQDRQEVLFLKNSDSRILKLDNDSRVTQIGHFLRRSSMDELPQFWNVLKGDMSLVGPRPAIPYEIENYKPWYFQRFEAKPGMTGLWQVVARNSVDFDDMVRLDIDYVENHSFWLDLKILFMTPAAIFLHRGVA